MRDERKIALIEFVSDLEALVADETIPIREFLDRVDDLKSRLDLLVEPRDISSEDRPYVDRIHELLISLADGPLQKRIDEIIDSPET